jgi:microcystin-dependent protein
MPTTARLKLPYPLESDPADVPVDIQRLAQALDAGTGVASVAVDLQGLLNALPAPGVVGRYYWATDQGSLYRDDGASWRIIGPQPADLKFGAGPSGGLGWLLADGSAIARGGANAALFALVGIGWGAGDGATTFNLPDFRNRTVIGASGTHALGSAGGEEQHRLIVAEMPGHAHAVSDPTHAHSVADPSHVHSYGFDLSVYCPPGAANFTFEGLGSSHNVNPAGTGIGIYGAATGIGIYGAGGDGAHNNMPPFAVGNPFIKL